MKITFKIETPGETPCEFTFTPKHFTAETAQRVILNALNDVVAADEGNSPALYDVWMEGYNDMKKINAIKGVRGTNGMDLKAAKDLVEGDFPALLASRVTVEAVQRMARELNEGGVIWRYNPVIA
jgi:ribosomal protein L7/L12